MPKQYASAPPRGGSGLVFAVILLFVILGGAVALSSITVLETKMSQKAKSQRAIETAVAAGGGGCYVSYGDPPQNPAPAPNKKCLEGFTDKGNIGAWGYCHASLAINTQIAYFFPPAGVCGQGSDYVLGNAHLCCR